MKAKWGLTAAVILALGAMLASRSGTVQGQLQPPAHYTVIETQGFNLLVTDNRARQLYYYATDKDAPIGSPLKLRASLDLTQVGKPEIKITPHNLEHLRRRLDGKKE